MLGQSGGSRDTERCSLNQDMDCWDSEAGLLQVRRWFARRGWSPFPYQEACWRAYLDGEGGLVHAPTGTGKTLAVWLGPVAQALSEPQTGSRGGLELVWLTPMRALANDIAEGLSLPCRELGLDWTVEVRTGDTPASVRSRQRRRLPEALVTTPESLSLQLSYPDSAERFQRLRCVVVDEWHELMGNKRGVQTELALARLRRWIPGLQTWGLSATLGNLGAALDVLAGNGPTLPYRLHRGDVTREIQVETVIPDEVECFPWAGHLGLRLLDAVLERISRASSTLLFTNTRSFCEIWYRAILEARPQWAGELAIHHGSLDRDNRAWVETALRQGRLRCVVCTSSLDLGVDFSPVDQVIQVGSPKGVSRLMQRAGRCGHSPGEVSRVVCIPTHSLELVELAALRQAVAAGAVEQRRSQGKPLDVLAQHLVTIAAGGGFDEQQLKQEVRTTVAYAGLDDEEWAWVMEFVTAGGRALGAYPEFHRLRRFSGRWATAGPSVDRRHRLTIGTITSDASLEVQFLNGRRLGRVEESFLTRLQPGDRFTLAGQVLEFVRLRASVAWVKRAQGGRGTVPRWGGGRMPLSSELAGFMRKILADSLHGDFNGPEMVAVRPLLELQARWSAVPGETELLIERIRTREGHHLFFYPFEGRLVHEGLSALLAWRLSRARPTTFSLSANDYGFELLAAHEIGLETALEQGLLSGENLVGEIRSSLNATEMARHQFRETARVAGLVFEGFPGSRKTGRQVQVSAGLLFDVFRRYDAENLLLRQAETEVLEKQLEQSRLVAALARMQQAKPLITSPRRPTPLAFPLMVDRLREQLSSEKFEDRIRRMALSLEAQRSGRSRKS